MTTPISKTKISFYQFSYIWFKLQSLSLPKHQRKIIKWLEKMYHSDQRQALLMAFRNSGKSTLVGLFCAWVLYDNNAIRILVMAADHSLAKKMVRNVKRIIERHPLTSSLKPDKLDQWAADQFTIKRNQELRDPSMLAKGLNANITGLRADIIICDDVEVPKNCDSPNKRTDMREKLQELDYILTPQGMQLYIGTPHTYYTIYQVEYDATKKEVDPFLYKFNKLEVPILNTAGASAWPERFPESKIASIRARSGENKFLSQMMLQPVNIAESLLDPERLKSYTDKLEIIFSNNRECLKLGDKKLISSSCWWDPSFGNTEAKNDNSVIACVFTDTQGGYWLHDLEYISVKDDGSSNVASMQCEKVIRFLKRNFLPSIRIESNGIGKFLPSILRQKLAEEKLRVAVLENYSTQNKQTRILEAFEVLLAERALNVHSKIWQTPFIAEMREWSVEANCKDDALDAVAGCILSEPIRITKPLLSTQDFTMQNWRGQSTDYKAKTNFDV